MEPREIDTGDEGLLCSIEQGVARITLHRPEARNALTLDMKLALWKLLPELDAADDARCILLTGSGSAFCAGGDTKRMKSEGKPPSLEDRRRQLRWEHDLPLWLHEMGTPTLASLPGAAAGAGLGLALACDIRLASDTAVLTTAYSRLGLAGDYGVAWFLTQLIGPARARELFFTSRRVDMVEAERLGLVNHVFAADELDQAATDLARQIAAGPPVAHRFMKENLNRATHADLATCLHHEADRMVRGAKTEDYLEAVAAFSEKRKPVFQGR
ncbi:MAG: enoyl-CoA hydratase-related protein [Myxococcota bacterium]|nr:enoyl-CoA hydratase-related protein [Myxococcota bacterium]